MLETIFIIERLVFVSRERPLIFVSFVGSYSEKFSIALLAERNVNTERTIAINFC